MRLPLIKAYYRHYVILTARFLLAFVLMGYGWAKLTGNQFGIDQKTMEMPLNQIDLFRISWYLADHQPFKAFIGMSQLGAALLLLINRTAVIGAFVSIPIWLNILIWDMTFMGLMTPFTFRLSYYLLLTGLIIYDRKDNVLPALWRISQPDTRFKYPLWLYLTVPLSALGLEFVGAIPNGLLALFR